MSMRFVLSAVLKLNYRARRSATGSMRIRIGCETLRWTRRSRGVGRKKSGNSSWRSYKSRIWVRAESPQLDPSSVMRRRMTRILAASVRMDKGRRNLWGLLQRMRTTSFWLKITAAMIMLPGAIPSVVVQGLRFHLRSDTRKFKVVSGISNSSISEIFITLSFRSALNCTYGEVHSTSEDYVFVQFWKRITGWRGSCLLRNGALKRKTNKDVSSSSDEDVEEDDDDEEVEPLKVFFCSRTHSQLSQFVGELQRTAFNSSLQSVTIGSRKTLCINPGELHTWWIAILFQSALILLKFKSPMVCHRLVSA